MRSGWTRVRPYAYIVVRWRQQDLIGFVAAPRRVGIVGGADVCLLVAKVEKGQACP